MSNLVPALAWVSLFALAGAWIVTFLLGRFVKRDKWGAPIKSGKTGAIHLTKEFLNEDGVRLWRIRNGLLLGALRERPGDR